MAEDTTICASSHTHIPSKESSEDLDDSLCPVQLKEMNETDRSLLRINGESSLKDIEGQDLYSSVTNGTVNQATFKLESSSYWIEQIKLAESVGKHLASIMFFQLAHECNAEPARSLKIELKCYQLLC